MENTLIIAGHSYSLLESITYSNNGCSYFYKYEDTIIIIDSNICDYSSVAFNYSLITDKQNHYMKNYSKVFRFLIEDMDTIEDFIKDNSDITFKTGIDRSESADASPLEFLFEKNFADAYGISSLKYLWKEYCISDTHGNNYFLDYLVRTKNGDIAIEENGIHYHHPQLIGIERYRKQLLKQNTCALWGIKLYRFSTEDCQFENRIVDDIKNFFGENTDSFLENGILAQRDFKLYEHQEITLETIKKQREEGIHSFLVVFPTATGKSKIIEEDLLSFSKENKNARVLILVPTRNLVDDWNIRINSTLSTIKENITLKTYSGISRNYSSYDQSYFDYIVVDEAHHAVAPVLKRVIQYFTPQFLIGMTATDKRLDNKKLESVFGNYSTPLTLQEAMEKNIISQANVYRIETNLDLSKVRFNGKDYVNADLEKSIRVTSRNELIADVLTQYFTRDGLDSKQGLIFCVSIKHTLEMERVLNSYGISAKSYTGTTKHSEQIIEDFKNKKIRFLCVCSKLNEGWDYPELGILVMARPTLSRVLYTQQLGRGLRKAKNKETVFVIDVVDEYGAMAKQCTMHSLMNNPIYVPFGNILKRDYQNGDMIIVDGLKEKIERIVEVDTNSYEDLYGEYLNQEQLAQEFFLSTGTILSWIKKGKIIPDQSFKFGSNKIYLFSPENVQKIRIENNIKEHNEETIKEDFFEFLEQRDYTLSYKMPFLLSIIKQHNENGEIEIQQLLNDYINFYQNRIDNNLKVDRATCPYTTEYLKDKKKVLNSILTNPFEKFERKRFMYYSKDLSMIALNHNLFEKLQEEDWKRIEQQINQDLDNYYKNI